MTAAVSLPVADVMAGLGADRVIRPMHDRVLVRRQPHVDKVGSLYLVGGRRLDTCVSEVVAIGPRVTLRPWELRAGDFVLHIRVAGVKYDGVLGALGRGGDAHKDGDLLFLLENELLAVVDPATIQTGEAVFDSDRMATATSEK